MSTVTLKNGNASYMIVLPHAKMDLIQKYIAENNEPFELCMVVDMASRLDENDLVLDVGANIGNHTLYLASVGGASACIRTKSRVVCWFK